MTASTPTVTAAIVPDVDASSAIFALNFLSSTLCANRIRVSHRQMVPIVAMDNVSVPVQSTGRLHERFKRDLPIAVEHEPLSPAVAHLVELELIEVAGGGLEVVT